MSFPTYQYILIFLPLTAAGYYLLNRIHEKLGRIFLGAASILFYCLVDAASVPWLLLSILVNAIVIFLLQIGEGKRISPHRKCILWAGLIFNIAFLFYFKYRNFAFTAAGALLHRDFPAADIALPVGISFYTFQQISYLADSYRGETTDNSLEDYLLYILYFPKFLMGPIIGQDQLVPQFYDMARKKPDASRIMKGIRMFNIGLFKKVILADTFAKAVSWAWGLGDFTQATSGDLILVMFAYTFQIYYDFSGYSDMAIGTSFILGIDLGINFDSPYQALSIRDFWKRWHVSLTGFLTKYIYIPLGGNRKGKVRTCLNTMIVFLISGIWHGANWTFILWGLLHGLLSVIDRFTDKWRRNIHPALRWMVCFLLVSILWLLFRADSVTQWGQLLKQIFCFQNVGISDGLIGSFILPETDLLLHVLHLEKINALVRGLPMILFYSGAFLLCLGPQNSYRRKYDNKLITALASAFIFAFCLTCLGGEATFVYSNF